MSPSAVGSGASMFSAVSMVCTSDAEGSGDCGSGVFIAEKVDGVGDKWLGVTQQSIFFFLNIFWLCFSVQFVLITNFMHFLNVFISLLYMFWASQCSSSGESIVSIHHLVHITLCMWLSSMQVSNLSLYWYNWSSWWWALACLKHVEKWNKHIKKVCQVDY